MPTMQDLITAYSTDTTDVANDTAAIAVAQASLTSDQNQQTADAAPLAAALAADGPVAVVSVDGTSVSIYVAAPASPGFSVTTYPVASQVVTS